MSVQLPEALVLKALVGAFRRQSEEACPHCGACIDPQGLQFDEDVQIIHPGDGESWITLVLPLECGRCDSGFEVTVSLHFDLEETKHVGPADADPLGAGDSGGHSSRDVHARFDGTGNWSR